MLLFVVGPPGRFAEWCGAVTSRLAETVLERSAVICANTLEEIACNLLRSGISHGVVAASQPGGRLRRALAEAGRPFIVALEDPRAALADLVLRHGTEIATATRTVASSCAASLCFRETPGALVLRAGREGSDPLSTAAAIARHLEIEIGDGEVADMVSSLRTDGVVVEPGDVGAWWNGLAPGQRSLAEGALGPYLDGFTANGPGPISWAPELFFVGDRPNEQVTGGLDITGRVRCLLRGPQILLPPGHWSLSLALHVSPEAAEHRFLLEVTAGAALSRTIIQPGDAGTIRADLTLMLDELPERPIDLALSNERPAFAGQLSLLHVTLTRQSPALAMATEAPERNESRTAGQ